MYQKFQYKSLGIQGVSKQIVATKKALSLAGVNIEDPFYCSHHPTYPTLIFDLVGGSCAKTNREEKVRHFWPFHALQFASHSTNNLAKISGRLKSSLFKSRVQYVMVFQQKHPHKSASVIHWSSPMTMTSYQTLVNLSIFQLTSLAAWYPKLVSFSHASLVFIDYTYIYIHICNAYLKGIIFRLGTFPPSPFKVVCVFNCRL